MRCFRRSVRIQMSANLVGYMSALQSAVKALEGSGMWESTLFIYASDNGGDPAAIGGGSNWPLRGRKSNLFQASCEWLPMHLVWCLIVIGFSCCFGCFHCISYFLCREACGYLLSSTANCCQRQPRYLQTALFLCSMPDMLARDFFSGHLIWTAYALH